MPFRHRLQGSRFEFKFVVSEACARAVREFMSSYLVPDEHAVPGTDGYPVNSLYLDSPDLVLFRQTARGLKNRFKLRIRFYDNNPASPAFLEIKRRVSDVIRKERAAITRAGVEHLLEGGRPDSLCLMANDTSWHSMWPYLSSKLPRFFIPPTITSPEQKKFTPLPLTDILAYRSLNCPD